MNLRAFLKKRFGKRETAANTSAGVVAGVVLLTVVAFVISPPGSDPDTTQHTTPDEIASAPLLPLTAPPPAPHLEAISTPVRPRSAAGTRGNVAASGPKHFVWPTPLPVKAGTPWEQVVQAAASGDPGTGLFGLHRNSGSKFHEGLDIRATARDRSGEPVDKVFAAIPGMVVHFTNVPNGPYGRYVVLWHGEPGLRFYTLYAHMRSLAPSLKRGEIVDAGHELGIMGRSENGRMFPKERAHLHFEVGVRLSGSFETWYARQRDFKTPNLQGIWNGINLSGADSLPFLQSGLAAGEIPSLLAQLRKEPVAFTVLVNTDKIPAFVRENPALLAAPIPIVLGGWKIEFAWHGLPLRWTPLSVPPVKGVGGVRNFIIQPGVDSALVRKATLRKMLGKRQRNGTILPGSVSTQVISILFE
jgi:murein DD-endopeptidase MepM/ murein hydrolase activator NlpD